MIDKKIYYDYMLNLKLYNHLDKKVNIKNLWDSIINKTLTMFKYKGLPDTLPFKEIEKLIQVNGKAFITEINKELVVLSCEYCSDEVNIYNQPIKVNCYIPTEREYKTFNISDGVLCTNDYLEIGISNIVSKYAYLINESEITLSIANKWKRGQKIFIANDDTTAESVRQYINKLNDGDDSFIVSSLLYDSLKVDGDKNNVNTLSELIEYDNYIKSQLSKEIGLFNNDVMKKERLITSEIKSKYNSTSPIIDNMLECRKQFINKLNSKYNITANVEFNSLWEIQKNTLNQGSVDNESGAN